MLLLLVACTPYLAPSTSTTRTPDAPDTAAGETAAPEERGTPTDDTATDTAAPDDAPATVELVTGDTCTTPCTFSARVTGPVVRLAYDADGYALGSGTPDDAAITYDFSQLGDRVIHVAAYDADDQLVAEDSRTVTVESDLPDVPYFYQYNNDLYPSSTCQNTSVAMLLAWYGWGGEPDDITAAYGKDTAQTVAGLASVFNAVAGDAGLSARLTGHTDGDIADVKALLDRGLPVIVHGYFTAYGHVLVVLGYDAGGYTVNDPAGSWSETFMGSGYGGGEPTAGDHIYYDAAAFEAALGTWDGYTPAPIWYHELR